jgi:hypothetical protein
MTDEALRNMTRNMMRNMTSNMMSNIYRVVIIASITLASLTAGSVALAQSAPIFIGQSGHGLEYFICADEGGVCRTADTRYVAYGVPGNFTFANIGGNFICNNATFGTDPAPGAIKACYVSFYSPHLNGSALPVQEGGTNVFGRGNVAYGANGSFNFIELPSSGGFFDCTNATFGDPAPGVVKACYSPSALYFIAAPEGGTISNLVQTPVAYGANGRFFHMILSGTVTCENATFGDPNPGIVKDCYSLIFPRIADEGQLFDLGVADAYRVLYGSGRNGIFSGGNMRNGNCDNSTFGDVDIGVIKHCYGRAFFIK